jgi:hypothetical protein
MRRAFTPRSLKSPSWRRSTRFSASSDHRGLIASTANSDKVGQRSQNDLTENDHALIMPSLRVR